MNSTSIFILISGFVASIFVVLFGIYSLCISRYSIFKGSGVPEKMASMVLSSIYLMAKNLVGIFIIAIILTLVSEKILQSNECLPVVSLIAGYLLGKDFSSSNISDKSKSDSGT